MIKNLLKYCFLLIILNSAPASSQNFQINVVHYSINDGLSQNTVNCVLQDSRGYLWFGTQDGLNRFDGYGFKTFRHVPDDKYSLSSNYIRSIVEDKDSFLWIATQNGLNKFDFRTRKFIVYKNNPNNSNSLPENDIKSLYIDNLGKIWIKSENTLAVFDPKKKIFSYAKHESDEFSFTSEDNYFSLADDNEGYLWMGSKSGLISYGKTNSQFFTYKINTDKTTNTKEVFKVYIYTEKQFFVGATDGIYSFSKELKKFNKLKSIEPTGSVKAVFKDSSDILWIGSEKGLFYLDRKDNIVKPVAITDNLSMIVQTGNISAFYLDKSNILWVASENGFFKIDRKPKKFQLYRQKISDNSVLASERIYSIYVDNENNLWIGTRKSGLNIYNRNTDEIKTLNATNSAIADDNIHCIVPDKKGNIWLGTSNGVFIYNQKSKKIISFNTFSGINFDYFFKKNRVSDILTDSKGKIWFATFNGLLLYEKDKVTIFKNKRNSPKEIVSDELLKIIERQNGSIWIASAKGVSRYLPETQNFINYTKENSNLSNNSCLTVFESTDKTLWVGTETGLNKFDEKTNTFKFYSSKSNGFANDYIYAIIEDSHNHLWMSTNKGIVKFNPFTLDVQNYSIEDGLQSFEFNVGAAFQTRQGEIFFGGVNGFNSFFPDSIKKNTYVPQPLITAFVKKSDTGEKEIITANKKQIVLHSNERSFDIYFALPEYTLPQKNQFKYRIKEIDTKWTNSENKNFAGFISLSPGDYTFELEAANSDNQWNYSPLVITIHIEAPWWRTKFALLIYLIMIVSFIVLMIRNYNKNIRKENKILQEKNRAAKEVTRQKELLALKNKSISDSIRYAKRIIEAMIPSERYFKKLLPQSFVLFKPKDIVSGDFYWIDQKDGKVFVAAVDCTGHGVPGAFMSIIGLDLLRNILSMGIDSPSEILVKLNSEVAKIFNKDGNDDYVKDGMDIAICAIDRFNKRVEFSGAINPLYILRDDNIIEIQGSRISIGPAEIQQQAVFENHVIDIIEGDVLYMFSDGYVDQFGGSSGKKYKYRRFRHLLLNIYKYELEKQKNVINDVIESWKGADEQVDDILVIGIKPL